MPDRIAWSDEEKNILKELWPSSKVTVNDILKVFPNRSRKAVEDQANDLGLKRPKGTEIDMEYLRNLRKVVRG